MINKEYAITVEAKITADDIVMSLDKEPIITLIKDIDGCMGDWDFTETLYNFFKAEMEHKDE